MITCIDMVKTFLLRVIFKIFWLIAHVYPPAVKIAQKSLDKQMDNLNKYYNGEKT